ncbi:MAG: redox-sensing transcriptional repressor Rex, partial [Oscillospiraceae bacterium]
MTNQNRVSLPVIKRLPKYFRYVSEMKQSGITKISSSELAKTMGTTASQVRQDFNCFGGFGQQGIGYNVDVLLDELTKLLFSEHKLNTVLIGTGKLGHAISSYLTAEARGYHLLSAFDISPKEVGHEVCGVKIRHIDELEDFCKETKPQIAVLCVPRESAKAIAPKLVTLGFKGVWNFSHYDLSVVYPELTVENVHLGDSL